MKRVAAPLVIVALVGVTAVRLPAQSGQAVSRTFATPMDRAWTTTESVLKSLGWTIDERDRTAGWLLTDSRGLDFKDFGVFGEGTRHKLRLTLKAPAEGRTTVSVERELYREKRILFGAFKEREPLQALDRNVETAVLEALDKALGPGAGLAPAPPAPIAAPVPAPGPAPPPEGGRGEFTYKVTYIVKGTAPGAMLTYRNPRGGTEQTSVRLPWETSFTVKGGEFLYVSAQNEGTSGSITCEILLDGVSRTNATSSGAYVIAECSSAAGRN